MIKNHKATGMTVALWFDIDRPCPSKTACSSSLRVYLKLLSNPVIFAGA